ncbi:hypothetical protein V8E55_011222, partial [Tylopilus felleus]
MRYFGIYYSKHATRSADQSRGLKISGQTNPCMLSDRSGIIGSPVVYIQGMFQLREINQMEKKMCQYLDMMHNLVEISLAPFVPALLRVIPTKYTIITRLWIHAFHKLLEALRKL